MEYFTLSDKSALVDLNGRKATFVKRNYNGYGDELAKAMHDLEEELRLRHFHVPGFEIEFYLDINKAEVRVSDIENLSMGFRSNGHWSLNIPKMEVSLHEDNSGSLDVYCGEDWDADMKEFMTGRKFHRKMDGLSRIQLHYDLWQGTFKATDDCDRGYLPVYPEPSSYSRHRIENEFTDYVIKVTEKVSETPVSKVVIDVFTEPEKVKLDNKMLKNKVLYGFSEYRSVEEIMANGLVPNHRLLSLGQKLPEGHQHANVMHDGFAYMELREMSDEMVLKPTDTRQFNYGFDSKYRGDRAFIVTPKRYNCFYVVDGSVFERLKAEFFKANPKMDRITDAQVNEYKTEQAKTLVPINEYKGGYTLPIVVTNRRIWPEELVVVVVKEKELAKA